MDIHDVRVMYKNVIVLCFIICLVFCIIFIYNLESISEELKRHFDKSINRIENRKKFDKYNV